MSPLPLVEFSERHLRAIGLMIIQVSDLELALADLGAFIMETDTLTVIATLGHQQFANRVSTLKALTNLRLNGHPEHAAILAALDAAKSVSDDRNTIVHAFWAVDEDGLPLAVRFSARGKIERSRRPMPAEQVEAIAQDALAARQGIEHLLDRLRASA